MLAKTEYGSVVAAVAHHVRFLPREVVAQTDGSALFPIVRRRAKANPPEPFQKPGKLADGRCVVFDDNTSPRDAFLWAAGLTPACYQDYVFTHVWDRDKAGGGDIFYSRDPNAYTALWNVCATPAFLAKTTDTNPKVRAALRFHAYNLYDAWPAMCPSS